MARRIVPLRPRQKEGPARSPKKRLTLADVTVVRRWEDKELGRISGPELAKLIEATKPDEERAPLVDRGSIWEELDCLAELCHVLSEADHNPRREMPLQKTLYWLGESLTRLGNRVVALEQGGNAAPNCYFLEKVTK